MGRWKPGRQVGRMLCDGPCGSDPFPKGCEWMAQWSEEGSRHPLFPSGSEVNSVSACSLLSPACLNTRYKNQRKLTSLSKARVKLPETRVSSQNCVVPGLGTKMLGPTDMQIMWNRPPKSIARSNLYCRHHRAKQLLASQGHSQSLGFWHCDNERRFQASFYSKKTSTRWWVKEILQSWGWAMRRVKGIFAILSSGLESRHILRFTTLVTGC